MGNKYIFERNAYWNKNNDIILDGPFCSACYDSLGKLVHLHLIEDAVYRCPVCNKIVELK